MHKEIPRGIMASIPEGMHTRAQVADLLGLSKDTIRRWQASGLYVPKHHKMYGENKVWLYTDEDITEMRKVARSTRTGKKPQ